MNCCACTDGSSLRRLLACLCLPLPNLTFQPIQRQKTAIHTELQYSSCPSFRLCLCLCFCFCLLDFPLSLHPRSLDTVPSKSRLKVRQTHPTLWSTPSPFVQASDVAAAIVPSSLPLLVTIITHHQHHHCRPPSPLSASPSLFTYTCGRGRSYQLRLADRLLSPFDTPVSRPPSVLWLPSLTRYPKHHLHQQKRPEPITSALDLHQAHSSTKHRPSTEELLLLCLQHQLVIASPSPSTP